MFQLRSAERRSEAVAPSYLGELPVGQFVARVRSFRQEIPLFSLRHARHLLDLSCGFSEAGCGL